MTLQYRIRSKYHDELWRQRVFLCEQLVADSYGRWCRSDEDSIATSDWSAFIDLMTSRLGLKPMWRKPRERGCRRQERIESGLNLATMEPAMNGGPIR